MLTERCFDLAELYSITPNLDLMIDAAEKCDIAI
jgi:hypothetical protein